MKMKIMTNITLIFNLVIIMLCFNYSNLRNLRLDNPGFPTYLLNNLGKNSYNSFSENSN